jgi:hypothetical protein
MELRPISLKAAMQFVDEWHRHLERPQGGKVAIAAWKGDKVVGVAIIGRPTSRMSQRDWSKAEVTRVASDGTRNVCSFLYARAKRAAQAIGYRRVFTKTLLSESGDSLRAVGARCLGETKGEQWDRENRRRRRQAIYEQPKLRWEL